MTRSARRALLAPALFVAALAAAAPASAAITLAPPAAYDVADPVTPAPPPQQLVAIADLNRDGRDDAVATDGVDTVSVALGGSGGLGAASTAFTDSHHTTAIAVGDVTGDAIPDVVTNGSHDLTVHEGAGDGTFTLGYMHGSGLGDCATALALGDVDRDGDVDVLASCPNGSVVVNRNDGAGSFATQTGFGLPVGAAPSRIVLADVTRDGILDLVANDTGVGGNAYVVPGIGDGSFGLATTVSGFAASQAIAVADVDRDGSPDLLGLTGGGAGSVAFRPGGGDGTFGAGSSIALATGRQADLGVADLDHDGKLDVAIGGVEGIGTLAGNGDGTFQAPVTQSPALSTGLALGDFDADGRADAAVLGADGTDLRSSRNATAIVAPNVRSTVTPPPVTGRGPVDTAIADVDRDGIPDLVVAEQTEYRVAVYLGNGDGTYADRVEYWPGGANPNHPVVADMNRDGKPDIVVGNYGSASVSVMLGHGDGTFDAGADAKIANAGTFVRPQGVQVGDFDGNGIPDVAISGDQDSGKVAVFLGVGDGTLGAPVSYSVGGNLPDLVAADFDRDGDLDLAATSYNNGRLRVLLGNGDGTFGAAVSYSAGGGTWYVRAADMDRDGILDLVTSNLADGSVSVLRGNGNGTFATHVDKAMASAPRGLDVGDLDGDGKLDVVGTAQTGTSVGVLPGNGDGTLGTEKTYTVGDSTYAAAIGDLNRDGVPDIVAPSYTGQKLYLLMGGVDTIAPTTSDNVPSGWATASPFRPTLTASDTGGGTVSRTYYEVGNPPATPTTSSSVYNPSSRPSMTTGQQISYFSVDTAGNAEAVKTSAAVKIDATRPTTTDDVPSTWRKTAITVTLTPADTGGSGVDTTYYSISTAATPPTPTGPQGHVYDSGTKPVLQNGERIRYLTRDVAGNSETAHTSVAAKVDTAAPTVTDNVPAVWRNANVTVTLTPADTGGSLVDKTYYEIGATPATPTTSSAVYNAAAKPVLADGQKISYLTTDFAGNDSGVKTSVAAQVDTAAPTTGDDVPSAIVGGPVDVTLSASDGGGSGVAHTYYEVGASPATPTAASPEYDPAAKPVLGDGQKIAYFSVDAVGNPEAPRTSDALRVDLELPVTTDDVPADWQPGPVEVTLAATTSGGSGVAHTYYEVGETPATPTAASPEYDPAAKPVLGDGERIVYFSVSGTGHEEAPRTSSALRVDATPPATTDDVPAGEVDGPTAVTLTADDGSGSGVSRTYYEVGAAPAVPTPASPVYDPAAKPSLAAGERIAYLSVDEVGNTEAPRLSGALQVRAAAAPTDNDTTPAAVTPPALTPPPALLPPDAAATPPDAKTARASSTGRLTVPGVTAACGTGPCVMFGAIDATIRGRKVTLGTAWLTVAGGRTSALTIRLSTYGRRTLSRHRRLRATASLRIYGPGALGMDHVTRRFTLLAPKKKKKAR